MNQPDHSVWADALSKFQSSSPGIQALWLVAWVITAAVPVYGLIRAAQAIAVALLARRSVLPVQPVSAICREPDGRWMFCAHGVAREPTREDVAAHHALLSRLRERRGDMSFPCT